MSGCKGWMAERVSEWMYGDTPILGLHIGALLESRRRGVGAMALSGGAVRDRWRTLVIPPTLRDSE